MNISWSASGRVRPGWGLPNIRTELQDAAAPRAEWRGTADVVLCDVPCSGLGIIRKKPEIRYKAPEEIAGLPALQAKILQNCAQYVKPGGTLVYSTCTILQRENEDVVRAFLAQNPDFCSRGMVASSVRRSAGRHGDTAAAHT